MSKAPPARFVTDFLGPEYDNDQVRSHITSYIICSTPRSGSGLLSRGLAATGLLGAPLEYFNPIHRQRLTERWGGGSDLRTYIETLHLRRSTPSGLFGVKIHWDQMAQVRAEATSTAEDRYIHTMPRGLFESLLPSPRFIRIIRLDLDSQAVSFWKARHSNVWSVSVDDEFTKGDTIPYQFEGIDDCRRVIENGELCWDRLIRERGAGTLVITYEDLATSFAKTIERVARYISPDIMVPAISPSTRKLSDDLSVKIVSRYRTDRLTKQ